MQKTVNDRCRKNLVSLLGPLTALLRPSAPSVTLAGVENNNWQDQGHRNAKTLMQILGGSAIEP